MSNTRRLRVWLLAAVSLVLALTACTTPDPVTKLVLNESSIELEVGATTEVSATLTTRSGKTHSGPVTWTSADIAVATVDNGTIAGVSAGSTVVTASHGSLNAELAVTVTDVSLEVTGLRIRPASLALVLGEVPSGQLTAELVYEDDSTAPATSVTWSSSANAIVTVSTDGLATGVAAGNATVTATAFGQSGTASVTVVAPAGPADAVTGLEATPTEADLLIGESSTIRVRFNHESGNTSPAAGLTWTSSNQAVATVSDGKITAVAAGNAVVTASASGFKVEINVTVTPPAGPGDLINGLEVVPSETNLEVGEVFEARARFTHVSGNTSPATGVTWATSDTAVATVTDGIITAIATGTATITATADGHTALVNVIVSVPADPIVSIQVSPATATINVGTLSALTVTATHASNSTSAISSASWTSSDTAVTVNSSGVIEGITVGSASVTASFAGFASSAAVTVVDPVATLTISPAVASVNAGDTVTFAATVSTVSGATSNVTVDAIWNSSEASVATVAGATVTAVAGGLSEITATYDGLIATAAIVNVRDTGHVFVGAASEPIGPLGTQLNPYSTISQALAAGIDYDATITVLENWTGEEEVDTLTLISHKLVGAGVDETIVRIADDANACAAILLTGNGSSVSNLTVDASTLADRSGCGAGPTAISMIGTSDNALAEVRVTDESVADDTAAAARNLVGIHVYQATNAILTNVSVVNSTRDAIQIVGGSVTVNGVEIVNGAQYQPGYGGVAVYSSTTVGATEVEFAGDWRFSEMPGSPAIVVRSSDGEDLSIDAATFAYFGTAETDVLFPLGVWGGLQDVAITNLDTQAMNINFLIVDTASPLTANFLVAAHTADPQVAVDLAIRYKNPAKDAGNNPYVLGADLNTIYVGTGTSSSEQLSLANALTAMRTDGYDHLRLLDGTYLTPTGGLIVYGDDITFKGESESGTIIDASGVSGYGMDVQGDRITLEGFTLLGPKDGQGYGIKAQPATPASATMTGLQITNVTVNGSKSSEIDLNTVQGATLTNVTAHGEGTAGVGIAITGSTDVTLTDITTSGNNWGGVALYTTGTDDFKLNDTSDISIQNLVADENVQVYSQYHGTKAITELALPGFSYAVRNPDHKTGGEGYIFYFRDVAAASAYALALEPAASSTIQTVNPADASILENYYIVAPGMRIHRAVAEVTADGTVMMLNGRHEFNGSSVGQLDIHGSDYKGVTLTGETTENTVVFPNANPGDNQEMANYGIIVRGGADDVTLTNFTVDLNGLPRGSSTGRVIAAQLVNNFTIRDVAVTGGVDMAMGLSFTAVSTAMVENVQIEAGIAGLYLKASEAVTLRNVTTLNNEVGINLETPRAGGEGYIVTGFDGLNATDFTSTDDTIPVMFTRHENRIVTNIMFDNAATHFPHAIRSDQLATPGTAGDCTVGSSASTRFTYFGTEASLTTLSEDICSDGFALLNTSPSDISQLTAP